MVKLNLLGVSSSEYDKRAFINGLRGLAVFLMLWGHSVQYCTGGQFDFFENIVFKIIYSFHMPFFMLISGYLFFFSEQKRKLVELIEYKIKSLLYPILMCSFLNMLLTTGITSVMGGYRKIITNTFGAIPLSSLWFLWSVLACSVAVAFAVKLTRNPVSQGLLFAAGILIVAFFPNWQMNIYMYPYFVIGYLYAKNEKRIRGYFDIIGVISSIGFVTMLFFFQKKHYIYTSGLLGGGTIGESLCIDSFRWAIGLFGSTSIVWTAQKVYGIVSAEIRTAVEELGKHSLAVYALSVSLLSFWLPIIINRILRFLTWVHWSNYIWIYNLIITPLVATAYSILLLKIIRIFKKHGIYRLLFGR